MLRKVRPLLKRLIDLSVATALLIWTAPIFVVVALTIRLSMGAPVLFRQTRPGLGGVPFEMLKFRTMHLTDPSRSVDSPDAARITKLGRFLRGTSLDELPELWNVMVGQMSLVGPRPLLMEYLPLYSKEQARRHEMRPGVTGWAQVNGRNSISWNDKFRLDVWYVDNWTLSLDLRIMAMTIQKVLAREGISHSSEATMPRFTGNQSHD